MSAYDLFRRITVPAVAVLDAVLVASGVHGVTLRPGESAGVTRAATGQGDLEPGRVAMTSARHSLMLAKMLGQ